MPFIEQETKEKKNKRKRAVSKDVQEHMRRILEAEFRCSPYYIVVHEVMQDEEMQQVFQDLKKAWKQHYDEEEPKEGIMSSVAIDEVSPLERFRATLPPEDDARLFNDPASFSAQVPELLASCAQKGYVFEYRFSHLMSRKRIREDVYFLVQVIPVGRENGGIDVEVLVYAGIVNSFVKRANRKLSFRFTHETDFVALCDSLVRALSRYKGNDFRDASLAFDLWLDSVVSEAL